MRESRILLFIAMTVGVAISTVTAQSVEQDPAMAQAKEETIIVYDLGRFFGYLLTVEKESSKLSLSTSQLEVLHEIMSAIASMERIEPEWAEVTLEHLELDVLTVDQLIAVDQIAISRQSSRDGSGTGAEAQQKGAGNSAGSTGSSPLQAYIAGGAFNPIIGDEKSLGAGFAELYVYVSKKLGK